MKAIINQLIKAAEQGQIEIESGNTSRFQVTIQEFREIVPEELEDAVYTALAVNNEWWCHSDGFTYRPIFDTA